MATMQESNLQGERLLARGRETIATVQTLMVRVRAETAVTQGNYKMQTKINKDAT